MTKRIPKVGDVYKCVVDDRLPTHCGDSLVITKVTGYYNFVGPDIFVDFGNEQVWNYSKWPDDFEFVSSEQHKFKGKHFINVKAYAEKYGITLAKAHEEIQPKLFDMGYIWPSGDTYVKYKTSNFLCLNLEELELRWCENEDETESDKEILIEREETVNLNFSVKEAPIEYVEFNGKQYEKAKLEQALKLIEGDE